MAERDSGRGGEIGGPTQHATSLPPDDNIVSHMLGPVISFFVVALSLALLRLYTRLTRRHGIDFRFSFSWEDFSLLLALLFTILQFTLLMAAAPHGVGRHNAYIPHDDEVKAMKLLFLSQLPWGWSVAFAKISIACLLLRLKSATSEGLWPWKVPLYFTIIIQIACAVTANIVQLTQCRPLRATWDPTVPGAVCQSPTIAHMAIYITGALAIVSDIFLATAPITFLKNVRRSIRERAILIFLMGLASFTAIATVVKLPMVEPYGKYGDSLSDTIGIMTWSSIEAYMGIIAASVPCLKSPFEGFLRRVGVLKSTSSNASDNGSWDSGHSNERYMHHGAMGIWGGHGDFGHHHHGHGFWHGHGQDRKHSQTHNIYNNNHPHTRSHSRSHSSTYGERRKSYRLSHILLPAVPISGGRFLSPKTTQDVGLTIDPNAASSEQSILDHGQKAEV